MINNSNDEKLFNELFMMQKIIYENIKNKKN
jgi:hypothetical protein